MTIMLGVSPSTVCVWPLLLLSWYDQKPVGVGCDQFVGCQPEYCACVATAAFVLV